MNCRLCHKRGSYELPGIPHLCKEHYLLVWQRAEPEHAPHDVTKARSTGTTINLFRMTYANEPENPWELVCEEHGGIVTHPTKAAAKEWMPAPEGWCPGCRGDA